MNRRTFVSLAATLPFLPYAVPLTSAAGQVRRVTEVSIDGDAFLINGKPTYAGRMFNGRKVEGLLMNIRAVQGIFEDRTPETAGQWAYPDTGRFDPDRNTREFVAAMPSWREHGLLAFTICLQGGSPGFGGRRGGGRGGRGRGAAGPTLENTAINPDGSLRSENMERLALILDQADQLGMVAIVSYFYFGQDQRLQDEEAVRTAVANVTNWLLDRDYRNVLVEVNNESGLNYDHEILNPERVPELIDIVRNTTRDGRRLLVTTSFPGPTAKSYREVPDTPSTSAVLRVSDFAIVHGNGTTPETFRRMIQATRALPGYRTMPVVCNEDPNFDFSEPGNNFMTALDEYVSWGYYDQAGFQTPPVDWTIGTDSKRQFFDLVRTVTGS